MAIDRSNATAFNDAEKYSNFIVQTLPELMLPEGLYRNVTDFMDGSTLHIPTVGAISIQEVAEGVPMNFTAIDSGEVTLSITDYIGDAWFISDEVRQDYRRIGALQSARAMESTKALAQWHETNLLAACNNAQTDADPNTINGQAHRIVSTETDNVISTDHFRKMKLAFDKANVPQGGRIAIVDPSVEYTLNGLATLVTSDNPQFEGIITEGFAQNHRFIRNIYGFDIWTSNYLPKGTFDDGTTTLASAVANVFMHAGSDQTTPIMYAERVSPSVEGWRDNEERRDKFQTTHRSGWGAQRADTLGIVITAESV